MLRLVEQAAADGSMLYDVVADLADGSDRVVYRGADRAHVAGVLDDLVDGRLPLDAVQAVFREVVLARHGGPRTLLLGRWALPMPFKAGRAQDRWTAAAARIDALRAEHGAAPRPAPPLIG